MPEIENSEDGSENTAAMLSELTEGLFGQDSDENAQQSSGEGQAPATPTVVEPAPQTPSPEGAPSQTPPAENSQQVQEVGAPQTWSKEAIAEWATIPARAQQEILKREQDMFRGIEQYKERAELGGKYDSVVEPYRAALAAENVDPVQLFQSFAGNHYLLVKGTPEQKVQLAANLLQSYGIPVEAVSNFLGNQPAPNPQLDAINQRMQTLEQQAQTRQNQENQQRMESLRKEVESFSADPKNIYFQELADDIVKILKTGTGLSLQQAYEMAIYQNPSTRQKEIDRMTSESLSKKQEEESARVAAATKAKSANVNTKAKTADGTIPVGSMDETLGETFEKIKARG